MKLEERSQYPVYLLSLGCSKNLVDAEFMVAQLRRAGYPIVQKPEEARVLIVNTCGFIDAAKEEAIAATLDLADYKDASCELLVMTGCLSERYTNEIESSLPEVDLILGAKSYFELVPALDEALFGERSKKIYKSSQKDDAIRHLHGKRKPATSVYAYLKIAEGCFHHCTYCAIPLIRGQHISRPMEELIQEAKDLIDQGYQELILVAQDLSAYGTDLYGKRCLNELIAKLLEIPGLQRLRTLYLYCDAINDQFIDLMAKHDAFVPYIDLPIQHASNRILKRMGRRETKEQLLEVFHRLRERIPGVALRTTVMVGFPGETDEDFQELLNFIKTIRFEHLGCFIYSPEEGTAAAEFPDQVPQEIAEKRYRQVMELQQGISHFFLNQQLGKKVEVLLEGVSSDGLYYLGRTVHQAPEVDGLVQVLAPHYPLEIGQMVEVELLETDGYNLIGQEVDVLN